jgi:Zn-dependent protease
MNRPFHLFTLFGVPVFADTGYALLLAISMFGNRDPADGALWAVCLTVSLLVHEFGHALAGVFFRLQPAIVLHMWGGLTFPGQAPRRDRDDAIMVAAGPAAGLALGLVALVATFALTAAGHQLEGTRLGSALFYLVFLNIVWTCVNLLPLWPLDGGQLFRLLMIKVVPERYLDRVVHGIGALIGLALVGVAVTMQQAFLAVMVGLMTWENAEILLGRKSSPALRRRNRHADALLKEARAALAHDPRESIRLAHQLRAERNLPDDLVGAAWEVLLLGSAALGEWDDVRRYARYAPSTAAVRAALARAEQARATGS